MPLPRLPFPFDARARVRRIVAASSTEEVPKHRQDRPAVTTVEEARQVLLDDQEEQGGIPTLPALVDTEETETGWAFSR
jgi:hypothetical protein